MRANHDRIRVVDRVALGATFGATMLIVVMFGATVSAPAQTTRTATSVAASAIMPAHCHSASRELDGYQKG